MRKVLFIVVVIGIAFIFVACETKTKKQSTENEANDLSTMTAEDICAIVGKIDQRSKAEINIDGITCSIYKRSEKYVRILTSDTLNKRYLQLVADSLKADRKVVYFHVPNYVEHGEEYGVIMYGIVDTYKPRREKQYTKTVINKPKRIEGQMRIRVSIIAKDFVERQLKSPKTADFCSDCVVEEVEPNVYTALSYVDAQNSLGTTIRTHYKLKLKWNGKEWNDINNWKLLGSKFE